MQVSTIDSLITGGIQLMLPKGWGYKPLLAATYFLFADKVLANRSPISLKTYSRDIRQILSKFNALIRNYSIRKI